MEGIGRGWPAHAHTDSSLLFLLVGLALPRFSFCASFRARRGHKILMVVNPSIPFDLQNKAVVRSAFLSGWYCNELPAAFFTLRIAALATPKHRYGSSWSFFRILLRTERC